MSIIDLIFWRTLVVLVKKKASKQKIYKARFEEHLMTFIMMKHKEEYIWLADTSNHIPKLTLLDHVN